MHILWSAQPLCKRNAAHLGVFLCWSPCNSVCFMQEHVYGYQRMRDSLGKEQYDAALLFYFFFAPFSCFLSFFFIGVVIFFTDKESEASHCNEEFIQPAMANFWHSLLGDYEDELSESLHDNWDCTGHFCFVAVLLDLAKVWQGLGVVRKATVFDKLCFLSRFSSIFHSNFVTVWWLLV